MKLEEKIFKDYQDALKQRDSVKTSTLSFLRASLANLVIEKGNKPLEDADVITVIKKHIKRSQDSIAQFKQGGRIDLAEKEEKELVILETYLPPQLTGEQLDVIIDEAVRESNAGSMKDMGKVMKIVLAKAAGSADSSQVSERVKAKLSAR